MLLDLVILGVPEVGLVATAHNRQQREPQLIYDIKQIKVPSTLHTA